MAYINAKVSTDAIRYRIVIWRSGVTDGPAIAWIMPECQTMFCGINYNYLLNTRPLINYQKTKQIPSTTKNRNRQEFNSSSPSKQVKDFEKQINETRNTTKMRFIEIQTTPYPPFNTYSIYSQYIGSSWELTPLSNNCQLSAFWEHSKMIMRMRNFTGVE